MSLYICTLAEVKAQLGIDDTVDDAALTVWLEGLQQRFDTYCQRRFLRDANRVELRSGGTPSLLLECFPVESVSEVLISADADWANGTAMTTFALHNRRGRLYYDSQGLTQWPTGVENIRVTYTGGYVAAGSEPGAGQSAMPEDLRRALIYQATYEWRNREQLGLVSINQAGQSASLAKPMLLAETLECLNPLRRIV